MAVVDDAIDVGVVVEGVVNPDGDGVVRPRVQVGLWLGV